MVKLVASNPSSTAVGDYLADDSGLGFLGGALLVGSLIGIVVLLKYFTKISIVLLFWIAFVLTRPFGATFGDLLTKSTENGGLNFGTKGSSLILFSVLVILVVYTTLNKNKLNVNKKQ